MPGALHWQQLALRIPQVLSEAELMLPLMLGREHSRRFAKVKRRHEELEVAAAGGGGGGGQGLSTISRALRNR